MAPDRWIADNDYDPKFSLWTRANVGEVLPEPPSPLGWDLVFEAGTILGWRDCMVNRLGIRDEEIHPTRPEALGLFGGYGYLGATLIRVWAERTPGMTAQAIDDAYFAGHPDVPPYVAEAWHEDSHTSEVMAGWLGWVMGDRDQSELEADRVEAHQIRASRPDLATATDEELLDRALSLKPVCRRMFDQHINQSGAASIAPGVIGAVCAAAGRPEATMHLIAGIGDVDSAAPSFAMWELSRTVRASSELDGLFAAGIDGLADRLAAADGPEVGAFNEAFVEFITEFGSRGPNEWDIHSPTWEQRPEMALALIDKMRLSPDGMSPMAENATREAERESLGAEVAAAVEGDAEAHGQFVAALGSAATFLPGRERSKTNIIRVIGEIRAAVWELGRRAVERGQLSEASDICLLFVDEVERYVRGELDAIGELVPERADYLRFLQSKEPPFITGSAPTPNTEWPDRGATVAPVGVAGDELTGLPGCPGKARGRAVVVEHPAQPGDLAPGDILVAPMTDPAWTPLFVPAAAVVVNVGAPLSHAIIVSRELGIPCVVSVNEATERIPHGATIEVDGDTGTVTILSV